MSLLHVALMRLFESSAFEIYVGGADVPAYSKLASGRLPAAADVQALLRSLR